MKAKILLSLCFIVFLNLKDTYSQRFGNEWIVYGQQYLKLSVDTKGIYRINKSYLDAAGFSTTGKNPKNLQLFFRGKEMAIFVNGESDNTFDSSDYIEFFAINNDGKIDEELYLINHTRPHPYVSIYSDETAYFLTYNNTTQGKRITVGPAANTSLTPEPYYMAKILTLPVLEHSQFTNSPGSPIDQQSYLEPHEGLTGPVIATNSSYSASVNLPNYKVNHGSDHTIVEGLVQSRNSGAKTLSFNISGNTGNISLSQLNTSPFTTILPVVNSPISININWVSPLTAGNYFSLCYHKVTYPSDFVLINNSEYELIQNSNGVSRVNFGGSVPAVAYDFTNFEDQKGITITSTDLFVNNTNEIRKIFVTNSTKIPKSFKLITFNKINQTNYDYIILTDPVIRSGADEYAKYRKSSIGGNYKVLIKEIRNNTAGEQSIVEEFTYGERSPIAIKRFADYVTEEGGNIKYLFLLGASYSLVQGLKLPTRDPLDLVPTFGYPGSDILLTSGIKGTSMNVPYIPTGRLSATSNQEVLDYLNKVKEFEKMTDYSWQKNIIHFTGAKNTSEQSSMATKMTNLNNITTSSSFGFFPQNFFQKIGTNLNNLEEVTTQFVNKVNDGVGIMNYLGHGNLASTDLNIGFMANPPTTKPFLSSFNGKFPFLFVNGCGVGNSFTAPRNGIVADWVKAPSRGAIAGYSQSYFSYESIDYYYMDMFYKTSFGNQTNVQNTVKNSKENATNLYLDQSIGNIVKQTNKNYESVYASQIVTNPILSSNLQQGILYADPAIVIFNSNLLKAKITEQNNVTCFGASNGSVVIAGMGGTAPYTISPSQTTNLSAGNYIYTVTDNTGATSTVAVQITQPEGSLASISPSNATLTCNNPSVSLIASGGGSSFIWSSGQTTSTISVTSPGTYKVTVTASNGCTSTANAVIGQNITTPNANISPTTSILNCNTSNIPVTAAGGVSYLWSTGQNTSTVNITNPNTYTVTVTDINGCTATASTVISQRPNPVAPNVTQGNANYCNQTVELSIGNTTAYNNGTYLFSVSNSSSTYSNLNMPNLGTYSANGGVYIIKVTDELGCTATNSISISPVPNPGVDQVITLVANNGVIFNTPTSSLNFVYRVSEINGSQAALTRIRVPKMAGYILTLTSGNPVLGFVVGNSNWTTNASNVSYYEFDRLPTFVCFQEEYLAFTLTRNTTNQSTFSLNLRLRNNSTGEQNTSNNFVTTVVSGQ
jgi:hypothetical protein